MHIILAILAVLGGAAFWWWRLKALGDAANEVTDMAGRAWGRHKRRKFLRKADDSPLEVIDDPATAAAVLMHVMASEDGQAGPEAEDAIRREISDTMGIADPTEMFTFSKWTASHATESSALMMRYAPIWQESLNTREKQDLVAMMERVCAAVSKGNPTQQHKLRLKKLQQRLGMPV
jgi:uncharacterized tellurite resistance protein B-like protein